MKAILIGPVPWVWFLHTAIKTLTTVPLQYLFFPIRAISNIQHSIFNIQYSIRAHFGSGMNLNLGQSKLHPASTRTYSCSSQLGLNQSRLAMYTEIFHFLGTILSQVSIKTLWRIFLRKLAPREPAPPAPVVLNVKNYFLLVWFVYQLSRNKPLWNKYMKIWILVLFICKQDQLPVSNGWPSNTSLS